MVIELHENHIHFRILLASILVIWLLRDCVITIFWSYVRIDILRC